MIKEKYKASPGKETQESSNPFPLLPPAVSNSRVTMLIYIRQYAWRPTTKETVIYAM